MRLRRRVHLSSVTLAVCRMRATHVVSGVWTVRTLSDIWAEGDVLLGWTDGLLWWHVDDLVGCRVGFDRQWRRKSQNANRVEDQVVKFRLCALNWSCWTLNFGRLLPRVCLPLDPSLKHEQHNEM